MVVFLAGIAMFVLKFAGQKMLGDHKLSKNENETTLSDGLMPLVSVEAVKKGTFREIIEDLTGKIDIEKSRLSFTLGGVVKSVKVNKGDKVRINEVLAELDTSELELKLKYKQNALEGAELELIKAEEVLEDEQVRFDTGLSQDKSKLKAALTDVKIRKNKVDAARLEVESAHQSLEKTVLKSPYAGTILEKKVSAGENVSPNQEIVTVLHETELYADIEIGEKEKSKINLNQKVTFSASDGQLVHGEVVAIIPALQGKAMVMTARVRLIDAKGTLLPGTFLTGDIVVTEQPDTLMVPLAAISKESDKHFVFVMDTEKNMVSRREVSLGAINHREAVVLSGIKEAEHVVTESSSLLKDGAKVRVDTRDLI